METGETRRCATSAIAMATSAMKMALCVATGALAHTREATMADITEATTRAAFRADLMRRPARTFVLRGNDLEARCQTANGDWRTTRLSSFDRCGGDIANDNGSLRCTGSGYGYGGRRDDDDYNRGYVGGYQGNNSYTQTCRDVRRRGDTLSAVCQSRDGDWHQTTLNDYQDCRGQIVNDGGNLRCDNSNYNNVSGGPGDYRGGYPGGSYAATCQNIRVSGDDLVASCQKTNGGWRNTKLDDFQGCRADIVNDNGRLRCGR